MIVRTDRCGGSRILRFSLSLFPRSFSLNRPFFASRRPPFGELHEIQCRKNCIDGWRGQRWKVWTISVTKWMCVRSENHLTLFYWVILGLLRFARKSRNARRGGKWGKIIWKILLRSFLRLQSKSSENSYFFFPYFTSPIKMERPIFFLILLGFIKSYLLLLIKAHKVTFGILSKFSF